MNKDTKLFFIIQKLLERPYTVSELQNLMFENFEFFPQPKDIHKYIKDLKNIGFEITETPRAKYVGASYKIEKTPFTYNLKESEKELIRDIFSTYKNNDYVLMDLFDNIGTLLNFNINEIIESKSNKVNNKLYNQAKKIIKQACTERKKVSFLYQANNKEPRVSTGFPCNIETDEKKVERFCLYIPDYPLEYRYIEYSFERIQSIPTVLNETMQGDFLPIFARFKLYHPTSTSYHLSAHDVVESRDIDNKTITIKTKYYTSFRLVQKLFKYGDTVEILEPLTARKMMKEKITNMQKIYSD